MGKPPRSRHLASDLDAPRSSLRLAIDRPGGFWLENSFVFCTTQYFDERFWPKVNQSMSHQEGVLPSSSASWSSSCFRFFIFCLAPASARAPAITRKGRVLRSALAHPWDPGTKGWSQPTPPLSPGSPCQLVWRNHSGHFGARCLLRPGQAPGPDPLQTRGPRVRRSRVGSVDKTWRGGRAGAGGRARARPGQRGRGGCLRGKGRAPTERSARACPAPPTGGRGENKTLALKKKKNHGSSGRKAEEFPTEPESPHVTREDSIHAVAQN